MMNGWIPDVTGQMKSSKKISNMIRRSSVYLYYTIHNTYIMQEMIKLYNYPSVVQNAVLQHDSSLLLYKYVHQRGGHWRKEAISTH